MREHFFSEPGRVARTICLLALLFLSACATAPAAAAKSPTQTVEPTMAMTMPASAITPANTPTDIPINGPKVTISNFTFTPGTLTVPVGATVTWVNQDDIVHTVTAADKTTFASQALDTGDRFTFKFTTPGTYSYFCTLHPKMVGKIIVQ